MCELYTCVYIDRTDTRLEQYTQQILLFDYVLLTGHFEFKVRLIGETIHVPYQRIKPGRYERCPRKAMKKYQHVMKKY